MKRALVPILALLLSLSSAACGRVKVAQVPGGRMHITCVKGMKDCVNRAGKICGDKGYRIFSGESRISLLGGSSSAYRKPSESAELEIQCGVVEQPEEPDIVFKLPKRKDEPLPPNTGEKVQAETKMCIPGSTQKCIGAGACEGGQVCLRDGSGFGRCDCGNSGVETHHAPVKESSPKEDEPNGREDSVDDESPQEAPNIPGSAPPPVPLGEEGSSGTGRVPQ